MRRIALFAILLAFSAIFPACSGKDLIASRAEHFIRSTYNDVDRVLHVTVDTVTYGDNLDYRIERARHDMEFSATLFRDFGGEMYEKDLEKAKAWVDALDSLKSVSGDVLGEPAAFNCIASYNTPGNLVWVQLDKFGNLLNITKDVKKILFNPGSDAPGYLELWDKYHEL